MRANGLENIANLCTMSSLAAIDVMYADIYRTAKKQCIGSTAVYHAHFTVSFYVYSLVMILMTSFFCNDINNVCLLLKLTDQPLDRLIYGCLSGSLRPCLL